MEDVQSYFLGQGSWSKVEHVSLSRAYSRLLFTCKAARRVAEGYWRLVHSRCQEDQEARPAIVCFEVSDEGVRVFESSGIREDAWQTALVLLANCVISDVEQEEGGAIRLVLHPRKN
jgi:hypothetical protein